MLSGIASLALIVFIGSPWSIAYHGLYEKLFLTMGNQAPEIEGEDIEGSPLRLSDHRGKVVVLTFWGFW
jgi:hypothetical protein